MPVHKTVCLFESHVQSDPTCASETCVAAARGKLKAEKAAKAPVEHARRDGNSVLESGPGNG